MACAWRPAGIAVAWRPRRRAVSGAGGYRGDRQRFRNRSPVPQFPHLPHKRWDAGGGGSWEGQLQLCTAQQSWGGLFFANGEGQSYFRGAQARTSYAFISSGARGPPSLVPNVPLSPGPPQPPPGGWMTPPPWLPPAPGLFLLPSPRGQLRLSPLRSPQSRGRSPPAFQPPPHRAHILPTEKKVGAFFWEVGGKEEFCWAVAIPVQPRCQRNASTATPLRPGQLMAGLGRRRLCSPLPHIPPFRGALCSELNPPDSCQVRG